MVRCDWSSDVCSSDLYYTHVSPFFVVTIRMKVLTFIRCCAPNFHRPLNHALCVFNPAPRAHRCPLTQLYYKPTSRSRTTVTSLSSSPTATFLYLPWWSPPAKPDTYTIVPELLNPLPEPAKIVVTFSPKKEIIAKSFGNQPVDAEIIAKFD